MIKIIDMNIIIRFLARDGNEEKLNKAILKMF